MLRLIFVLGVIAVGCATAIYSAFGALLFYMWFALFRPQEWVWIDITAYRPSLVIGLILVVRCVVSGILPNLSHPLSIGAVLFLLAAFVGLQGAVDPELAWYWFDFLSKLIVVTLFLITLTSSRQRAVILLAVISASFGFFTAKAGMVSLAGGGLQFREGLAGAFGDNNTYALGAVMVLYLLIATAQNVSSRWVARGYWLAAPLTVMTVVSTFSRAGFLALVASALVFTLVQRRRWLLLSVALAVLPLLLIVAPIPQGYADRIQTIRTFQDSEETSALSRFHFWRVALRISADHPLGIGLWNFESVYDSYDDLDGLYGRRRAVHNSFLQALDETGWLGGALFVALHGYGFVVCFLIRRRARLPGLPPPDSRFLATVGGALMASMVGFVVGGFFVSMAYNDLTWLTFGIVAAVDRLSVAMTKERAAALSPGTAPATV